MSKKQTTPSTLTVRMGKGSHRLLGDLAKRTGKTMTDVLQDALEEYRRKVFFEQLNAGYAALRADEETWKQLKAEQKLWDATLTDGLEAKERWTEDGRCLTPE